MRAPFSMTPLLLESNSIAFLSRSVSEQREIVYRIVSTDQEPQAGINVDILLVLIILEGSSLAQDIPGKATLA